MSEDIYSQFIPFTVTESAASTFTKGATIMTGASVNRIQDQNLGLEIHAIECTSTLPADAAAANVSESVTVCLSTRDDLAAMPNFTDAHVIYMNQILVKAGVATYLPIIMSTDRYNKPHTEYVNPILLAHDKVYCYILSTNSAAAASTWGRFIFTFVLMGPELAMEALEVFR